jgi:3-oxoacyl-[acyl-carrier protein] reductase
MKEGRLKGRVALVTGSARGIGKAVVLKMIEEGASVIATDILDRELSQAVAEFESAGGDVLGHAADVSKAEEVSRLVDRAAKRFGAIDILVNNAGIVRPASLEAVSEEDWEKVFSVNVKGAFYCARAIAPFMKEKRYGKIVNLGSRASLGKLDRTAYSASKAGLLGMTRTWALELAPFNITVNYVGPGPIETELFSKANPAESKQTKAIIEGIPLRRMGKPEEVAHLVSFLSSDEASFITGQSIFICGGLTVGLAHF